MKGDSGEFVGLSTKFGCEVWLVARVRARPPDLGKEILAITRRCDDLINLTKYETWGFQVYL